MKYDDIVIVAARQLYLAQALADHYDKQLIIPKITTFADGEKEIFFENPALFYDKKVLLVHPTCPRVAEEIIVLTLLARIIKAAGCKELVTLIPYLGYSRHTKVIMSHIPSEAHMIIQLLESLPIDHFVTVELHDEKDQDFFVMPMKQVILAPLLTDYLTTKITGDYCIVAPDAGAYERAQKIAQLLNKPVIAYHKKRIGVDTIRLESSTDFSLHKKAIIIDDIIDTGGTALQVARDLKEKGVQEVYGCFIHGIFSKKENIPLLFKQFTTIFVSNSVPVLLQDATSLEVFDISKAVIPYL